MRKINFFTVFLFLFFLFSCGKDVPKSTVIFSESDFHEKIKLTGVEMQFDSLIWNPTEITVKDSLLFLKNKGTEYLYDVFKIDFDTRRLVNQCLTLGNGPGEKIYPRLIQSEDNDLWIYDVPKSNLSRYKTVDFITQSQPAAIEEFRYTFLSREVKVLSNRSILITTPLPRDPQAFIYSLDGAILKSIGTPMLDDKDLFFEEEQIELIQPGKRIATNFRDRIAISYLDVDLIEIFDFDGKKIKQIFGPNQYMPSGKEVSDSYSRGFVSTAESRACYTFSQQVGDELFNLYSGVLYREWHNLDNLILVFDWDGNPLRIYELDIPLICFSVDSKNKIIYGISKSPEYRIIKYKY